MNMLSYQEGFAALEVASKCGHATVVGLLLTDKVICLWFKDLPL
jgi:hypothetical protein